MVLSSAGPNDPWGAWKKERTVCRSDDNRFVVEASGANMARRRPTPTGDRPMQYMILIYDDEKAMEAMAPEQQQQIFSAYMAYSEEMAKAGVMRAGDALKPIATATTVRVRNGKTLTTDGPFAETKEQLGGYYLIDVPNLEEALKWAAKCPSAAHGSIEVRPVMMFQK
jgi:hypothetical protein